MKKIAVILIAILFLGCSKDEPICWICTVTVSGGGRQAPWQFEECNDSEHPPVTYSDGQGNTWGGFECEKK